MNAATRAAAPHEGAAPRPAAAGAQRRTTRLRSLLEGPDLDFLMEAHSGLSARIVEEAGFPAVWASGLTLSAQSGVRDNNELSWTQVLDQVEFMADASGLPVLLDGDTGYGDFNNARRLVRKLEQRGAAGVCLEDKTFPKTNSFINSLAQPLADVDEFSGKLKAVKDSQLDPDFCLVARVEALIAGWGLGEALRRAEAYRLSGADAILIHSRERHAGEILAFAREWAGRSPLVIVPTTYAAGTPTDTFRAAGVSVAIWANHMLRAATRAMQETARAVRAEETPAGLGTAVVPVAELFRLQDAEELSRAERRYLPARRAAPDAVVLGAGDTEPAAEEAGESALTSVLGAQGVRRIVQATQARGAAGELHALQAALADVGDDVVVSRAGLRLRGYLLRELLDTEGAVAVAVDPGSGARGDCRCSAPDAPGPERQDVRLRHVAEPAGPAAPAAHGRWLGILRARGEGAHALRAVLRDLTGRRAARPYVLPDLLNALIARGCQIQVLYVHGHWADTSYHPAGAPAVGEGAMSGPSHTYGTTRGRLSPLG
ncbi:phosphoenolpyruvate mutase [Streptomyces sp. NPDC047002]|uniref:phosphoenolpyruvate mutase n=1 Tax=Streptomyces sp. NPDC047002 TaxID=3155475 RepID=UPI00345546FC